MKALILNSGLGSRMGDLTSEQPKCMAPISSDDTILSRQLKLIAQAGIEEIVMTTGAFDDVLASYCESLHLPLQYTFVKNPIYDETNYIYSIYCARDYLEDDILLLHGDLVFENRVLLDALHCGDSCVAVSSTKPLPKNDFKAIIQCDRVVKIGTEFFDGAMAAQPIYSLKKKDWTCWLKMIETFCKAGNTKCYAENAFNEVSDRCSIVPLDVKNSLCNEVDTPQDLSDIRARLEDIANRTVYMCFSTDVVHSGHIDILKKAATLGKVTIGALSDEAVASYKRFPLIPFHERKRLLESIVDVHQVVEQKTLSYIDNLRTFHPDYVVHGDDWQSGFQKPIRDEVVKTLAEIGGELVEYPYRKDEEYIHLEQQARLQLSMPDHRRSRLRKLLNMKPIVSILEAHSGITGLIVERTAAYKDGKTFQFDGMWVSSLCDSTAKGKPDIELVDMSSRLQTIDNIMEVTTKPIILDGDTGGLTEHFVYNVRTLERIGVSAVIIEDKTGLKKNSLFGNDVVQTQDSIENFSAKIAEGKKAQRTSDFMIIARIESLILEKGLDDALQRAFAYTAAGADGIMIHSRQKDPRDIFTFAQRFRSKDPSTPLVVVPTTFDTVTEPELAQHGINIVIYANQLTRSGFPAMQKTALCILQHQRAREANDMCMSIKEILTLIPEE